MKLHVVFKHTSANRSLQTLIQWENTCVSLHAHTVSGV